MKERTVDYLFGRLTPEERARFEAELSASPELREELEEFRKIFKVSEELAKKSYEPNPLLAERIMEQVSKESSRRFFMSGVLSKRVVYPSGLVLTALLAVALTLRNQSSVQFQRIGSAVGSTEGVTVGEKNGPTRLNEVDAKDGETSAVAGAPVPYDKMIDVFATAADEYKKLDKQLEKLEIRGKGQQQEPASNATEMVVSRMERSDGPAIGSRQGQRVDYFRVAPAAKSKEDSRTPAVHQAELSNPFVYGGSEEMSELGRDAERKIASIEQNRGERYGQYEENTPQLVTQQPVSTFSIDVDTGSYTNARRFIMNGTLPPQDSVRVEEFINYFDYNYPTVNDGKPFSVNYEVAPSPLQKEKYLLKVGIKAKAPVYNEDKGWNLVFLIDVSGSMSDNDKLPLIKQAFRMLVTKMRPVDRVGIVTYAGEAGVLLNSTPGTEKEKILAAIDRLGAGGSTNGSGGITAAYDLAIRSRQHDGVNRVILATDGDFNVGTTSFEGLVQMAEEKRRSGITLTTIGVGQGNYNERNLEQLANKGNGNYFYLDSVKEAENVFGSKLASNMEVVAKDVKLQLEFNPEHVAAYRLVGYDNRRLQNQDFNNDAIDAGEIGAGHTVTALYELILTGSDAAKALESELRYQQGKPEQKLVATNELAFLKIRYKEPNGDSSKLLEFPLDKGSVLSKASDASTDFRFASAVAGLAQILRGSRYANDYTMQDVIELIGANKGNDTTGAREEFRALAVKANYLRGASR